jgi:Tol biopolymer transport system component
MTGARVLAAAAIAALFPVQLATAQVVARASVSSQGAQSTAANQPLRNATQPDISGDGRFVVFASGAGSLVPNDTNGYMDVFVHDRVLRTTTQISNRSTGAQPADDSLQPAISRNGRFIVFSS